MRSTPFPAVTGEGVKELLYRVAARLKELPPPRPKCRYTGRYSRLPAKTGFPGYKRSGRGLSLGRREVAEADCPL